MKTSPSSVSRRDRGVRGYQTYRPYTKKRQWVDHTKTILDEYQDEWPLTGRQIFYRLVAVYGYDKTEKAAEDLGKMLTATRRSGEIPFEAIRDDTLRSSRPSMWDSGEDFLDSVRQQAGNLRLDRQAGQPYHLEAWCEAAGAIPTLEKATAPYSIRVSSNGGYDSVTAKNDLATRVYLRSLDGIKTVVLHVGDFDPSGENMAEVLAEDVGVMVEQREQWYYALARKHPELTHEELVDMVLEDVVGMTRAREARGKRIEGWEPQPSRWLEVERVALTEDQVLERDVITAIPKPGDTRSYGFCEKHPRIIQKLGYPSNWRSQVEKRERNGKRGTEYHNLPSITVQLEALTPTELRELLTSTIEEYVDQDAYEQVLADETREQIVLQSRLPRNLTHRGIRPWSGLATWRSRGEWRTA